PPVSSSRTGLPALAGRSPNGQETSDGRKLEAPRGDAQARVEEGLSRRHGRPRSAGARGPRAHAEGRGPRVPPRSEEEGACGSRRGDDGEVGAPAAQVTDSR